MAIETNPAVPIIIVAVVYELGRYTYVPYICYAHNVFSGFQRFKRVERPLNVMNLKDIHQ